MKTLLILSLCAVLGLSACDGWPVGTIVTYNPPSPFPSRTPSIRTPTPIILSPSPAASLTETLAITSLTPTLASATAISETPTSSETTPSFTPSPSNTAPAETLKADILGCDTSIDVLHGMGEVTNAYVTISNPTAADVNDLCATLNGLDEGRPHPDKTKCISNLAAGYQVTLKLTVDTTYKEQSPVQVDVNTGGSLLLRVGQPACRDIRLFPPDMSELGIPQPIP